MKIHIGEWVGGVLINNSRYRPNSVLEGGYTEVLALTKELLENGLDVKISNKENEFRVVVDESGGNFRQR